MTAALAVRVPLVSDVIMVRAAPAQNNGSTEAPAVITRVWACMPGGVAIVNVRVLLDGSDATPAKASVSLYPDKETADAAVPTVTNTHVGWWPPRV